MCASYLSLNLVCECICMNLMYEFQCKNHGFPMPEDVANVEIDCGQDDESESTT